MENRYYNKELDLDGTAEELFIEVRNGYTETPEAVAYIKNIIEQECTVLENGTVGKSGVTATPKMRELIGYLYESVCEEQDKSVSNDYNIGKIKFDIANGYKGCLIEDVRENENLTSSLFLDRDQLVLSFEGPNWYSSGNATLSKEEFLKMDRKAFDRWKSEAHFYLDTVPIDMDEPTKKTKNDYERD
jgi:hypothetical protein